jgi:hypothetical protein
MIPVWAQRKEELRSDCIVSPDVFNSMVERLHDVDDPPGKKAGPGQYYCANAWKPCCWACVPKTPTTSPVARR